MSFYLRKSVSVGPFRFNLSGSGVGISAGVKGFRVGTGPRGNYVHLGRGGVYYRQSLPATPVAPRPSAGDAMTEIESGAATSIVDASSEDWIAELREKRRKLALQPFAVAGAVLLLLLGVATGSGSAVLLFAVAGLALILAARRRDRIAKTTVILYELEPAVEDAFRRFHEWGEALASAARTWHIAASGQVSDRKYHAGASSVVRRAVTAVRTSAPPLLQTNVPVLSIGAGRQTLYFLPDRLLVYDAGGVGAVSYRTLRLSVTRTRFVEEERVPADATVVDRTWRYVNKSGGPDRRFNPNPELPICLYDELAFSTPNGLNEVFQISRAGVAEGFPAAVSRLE